METGTAKRIFAMPASLSDPPLHAVQRECRAAGGHGTPTTPVASDVEGLPHDMKPTISALAERMKL
jgi:hypothetical protein